MYMRTGAHPGLWVCVLVVGRLDVMDKGEVGITMEEQPGAIIMVGRSGCSEALVCPKVRVT